MAACLEVQLACRDCIRVLTVCQPRHTAGPRTNGARCHRIDTRQDVSLGVHSAAQGSGARIGDEPLAVSDEAAAARLRTEVQRLYREKTRERFTKTGLSDLTGIHRPTLDNWLEHGKMPPPDGMAKLAQAIGTPPAQLWIRWLDLGTPEPALERIAVALETMAGMDATPPVPGQLVRATRAQAEAPRRHARVRGTAGS
jgi:hypothetical protein